MTTLATVLTNLRTFKADLEKERATLAEQRNLADADRLKAEQRWKKIDDDYLAVCDAVRVISRALDSMGVEG